MERNKDDVSNPRSRLQLQLVGAKNWNMTSAELGRLNSMARNRETRKQIMSQEQKKWRKIVENASEETKRVIEFAELLEGTRLGMDMERRDEDDGLDVESPKSRRRRKSRSCGGS